MKVFDQIRRTVSIIAAGIIACAVTFVSSAGFCSVQVNGDSVNRVSVDRHNYREGIYWSSPETSFVVKLDDGGYMLFYVNVQLGITDDGYHIEYYDSSFNFVSKKDLDSELEMFGAFYSDPTGYYVFSGQANEEQSADVECYRLTKYDKEWNRISSCGFYDCNTYFPFEGGGADIATSGKYMAIRTCHTMYAIGDGLHHQANVTALVDTSEMKILDINYKVSNMSTGYCSHSFNQYVKIENNHIIGVDHGDAHPRGIGLWHYGADITSGKFQNPKPQYYPFFEFGVSDTGHINYTGAALGGFEITDTSYIIAGNSIDQENFSSELEDVEESAYGRNIFVCIMDKSTGKTDTKWLTTDATASYGYYNPYLVKVNDNSFVVIWSATGKENTVKYAFIDGKGNIQGSVKSAPAYLTDCQPILSGNKIVWFGNERNNIFELEFEEFDYKTFIYSIDTADKSFSVKTLYHLDIEDTKNGKATLSSLRASAGQEITVDLSPDEGYELSYILVNGKRINGNKFTMPEDAVMVKVNFKRTGSPNLDDPVTVGEYSYQVTNSDTEGAGTVMITGVTDQVTAVVIPPTIDINGYTYKVNKVAARAFFGNTTIKTVYIGANVTVIDINAFFGCSNLVKASGGAGLKVIGQNAFARCPKLSTFIITSKVLYKIGPQAFYLDSRLKTIYIKNTTKLTKSGVKKSLKGSKVKTVKVKKSKVWKYRSIFKKSNSGRKVKVKK